MYGFTDGYDAPTGSETWSHTASRRACAWFLSGFYLVFCLVYLQSRTPSPSRTASPPPRLRAASRAGDLSLTGELSQTFNSGDRLAAANSVASIRLGSPELSFEEDKLRRTYVSKIKAAAIGTGPKETPRAQFISGVHAKASKMGVHSPGPKYVPREFSRAAPRAARTRTGLRVRSGTVSDRRTRMSPSEGDRDEDRDEDKDEDRDEDRDEDFRLVISPSHSFLM